MNFKVLIQYVLDDVIHLVNNNDKLTFYYGYIGEFLVWPLLEGLVKHGVKLLSEAVKISLYWVARKISSVSTVGREL